MNTSADEHYQIGFEIGWDHAANGLLLMPSHGEAIVKGHHAWLASHPAGSNPSQPATAWQRKWLLVRSNAWRRYIRFATDVTPEYLKSITPDICPITRRPLTMGTLEESDWSVERVNNELGYARGNIAIISTFANRAKGAKSPAQLVAEATEDVSRVGLDAGQALRLASLANMAIADEYLDAPFALHPPAGVTVLNLRYKARAVILTTALWCDRSAIPIAWANNKRRRRALANLIVSVGSNCERLSMAQYDGTDTSRQIIEDAVTQPAALHFLKLFEKEICEGNPATIFASSERNRIEATWQDFARVRSR